MQIKNKFEKILIITTGLLAMSLIVFGMKIKEDSRKISAIQDELNNFNYSISNSLAMQSQVLSSREELLNRIATAPAPDTTRAVTTQVVVPGKVVPQQIPVTSTKKTKTS